MGFTLRRSPSEDRRLRANAAAAARSTAKGVHRSSRNRDSAVSPLPRDSSKHSLTSSDDEEDDDESSTASRSSSSWSTSSSSFPANVPLSAGLQSASAMPVPPQLPRSTVEHTDSDEANLGTEARIVRRLTRRYVEAAMADPAPAMPPPRTAISQESARDLLARTRAAARRLRETRRRLELASQTARRAAHPTTGAPESASDDSDSSMDIDRAQRPQSQYIAAPASASTAPFWSLVVRLDGMLVDSVHQTHPASPVTFSRDAYLPEPEADWTTPRGGALIADGIVPVTDRVRMLASPAPTATGPGMEPEPVGEDAIRGTRRVVNAAGTDMQRHLA
ncbi:hypothetical protein AMAG_14789 [Allomyces macrogynus ATCC 38327]|uniref:Uncharacterized protein n=1 Tax=Allomyces macrogynus (strain ATCC 38327) TaxID=578462 RepID=A0A0L0T567_ALLM3|nr:hypothetical protein AMAG_14789 [Allomyces macrogynus ATCC 38327]|eukprot:KNE69948.1 hypothetical protein AMAG_14789 [Allomyces macrogynus ATCC 38327]